MLAIINGPNLNLLGRRQPEIYGTKTFDETLAEFRADFADTRIEYFQSNSEGDLIDALHRLGYDPDCGGIALNPGAYAHYSIAIADAIEAIPVPVVEVHISNIHAREEFRHVSLLASVAVGSVMGFGLDSYRLGIEALLERARASALQQ